MGNVSARHFGDDWREYFSASIRFVLGTAVITMPVAFHADAAVAAFTALVGSAPATGLVTVLQPVGWAAAAGVVTDLATQHARAPSLELATLVLLAATLPPLAFFACYICGLHAIRHSIQTRDAGLGLRHRRLWSALVTTLTIAAGGVVAVIADGGNWTETMVRVTFIGLSALTVPHMLLIASEPARASSGEAPRAS